MISISNVKSASSTVHYFEKDNYYAKDSPEHLRLSEWYGKGANYLNLSGEVKKEDFEKVLQGKLGTVELGRKEENEIVHAPGIDMTFSAPKSVSIMAEVNGDKRLYDAQRRAVYNTLKYIEAELIETRKQQDGTLTNEKVDNLTAALFLHNTSRNLDPQLHTHCVIANAVKREDGEWRSAYLKKIFDNKLYLGQIYRSELAYEVKQLGYDIRVTNDTSGFEIANISDELIEKFSTRSKEIKEAAAKLEHVDAKVKAALTLTTRKQKREVSREVLHEKWNQIYDEHKEQSRSGSIKEYALNKWEQFCEKYESLKLSSIKYESKEVTDPVQTSLDYAIAHLSERSSVWSEADMVAVALSNRVGQITHSQVLAGIYKYVKEGGLLSSKNITTQGLYTTKEALESEQRTIGYIERSKEATTIIGTSHSIQEYLDSTSMTNGQKDAVSLILTSKDRIVGVQGYAGVGKTFMLEHAKKLANENGYEFIGIAPSASAARTLMTEAGIESTTVHKFLYKYEGLLKDKETAKGLEIMRAAMDKKVIIMDEASLSSTSQMNALLKVSEKLNFKVVLVGDIQQLGAVEAGKPFYQLQRAGMNTAIIKETQRYKEKALKDIIGSVIDGKIKAALKKLDGNIIETGGNSKPELGANLIRNTVDQWKKLSPIERQKTLITVPSNKLRSEINKEIRAVLKQEGHLQGESLVIDRLKSLGLTSIQKNNIQSYRVNNVLVFQKGIKALGVKAGEELTITKIVKGHLKLSKEDGSSVYLNPKQLSKQQLSMLNVNTREKLEIMKGDTLMWTKNNGKFVNSSNIEITGLGKESVTFKDDKGKEYEVAKASPLLKYIDYAYASTVHAAQGKTYDNVIAVLQSTHKFLTNQKMFYVSISRAKLKAILITDNKMKLFETLLSVTGDRHSAIEHQAADKLAAKPTPQMSVKEFKEFKKYSMEEIYSRLYPQLPSMLSEFGFVRRGSYLISTTEHKVDGSQGKKGKVYIYANNPGQIVDFTRENMSVWDYVNKMHLNYASKQDTMKCLCSLAGLSNESVKPITPTVKQEIKVPKVIPRDHKLLDAIAVYTTSALFKEYNTVLKYLRTERGYNDKEIKAMGLGFLKSKADLARYLKSQGFSDTKIQEAYKLLHYIGRDHKLIIPYKDMDGKIAGFAARLTSDKQDMSKYLYTKGLDKSNTLCAPSGLASTKHVIAVEGVIDALRLNAQGVKNVIALGGTSLNNTQLDILKSKGVKSITLALDNDLAGKEATQRISKMIKDSKAPIELKALTLPKSIKDPDQLISQSGGSSFNKLVNEAKTISAPSPIKSKDHVLEV